MPTIKRFRATKTTTQVSTGVASFGGGATARALANLGGQAAQMGIGMLAELKDSEARTFAMTERRNKAVGREQFVRDMQMRLDANSGKIGVRENMPPSEYEGKYYTEAIEDWEQNTTNKIGNTAPTELAKKYFISEDADSYVPAEGEESRFRYGNNEIAKNIADAMKAKNLYPDQKETLINVGAGNIANSTLNSQMNGEDYNGAAASLGLFDMGPIKLEEMLKHLNETSDRKYISVTKNKEGNISAFWLNEGEKEVKYDKDGNPTNTSQLLITKGFDVGGEYERSRNLVGHYLTPADHRRWTNKLFSKMGTKDFEKERSTLKMVKRVQIAFNSPDPNIRIDSGSAKGKKLFNDALDQVGKTLKGETKNEAVKNIVASVITGDTYDDLSTKSTANGTRFIDNNVDRIVSEAEKVFADGFKVTGSEKVAFGLGLKSYVSKMLKLENQRLDKVRGTNEGQVAAFHLQNITKAAFEFGKNAHGDKQEWDRYVDSMDAAAKQLGKKVQYFPRAVIESDVDRISKSLELGKKENVMDIVSEAWLRSNYMGPQYAAWAKEVDKGSVEVTGVELALPLLFSKDAKGYQAAVHALLNKLSKDKIELAGSEFSVTLKDFIIEADETLGPHRKAILQSGESAGNWNSYKAAGEAVGLEAMKRYVKDARAGKGGDKDTAAFEEATEQAAGMMIHRQTNVVKNGADYVSTPVSVLEANGIKYDPDTSESPTMEAAVRVLKDPENFVRNTPYEKIPFIRAYLDEAKVKGKKDRDAAVLELFEDENLSLTVTNTKEGLLLKVQDVVTRDSLPVGSMSFEAIPQDQSIMEEEESGKPLVEKAFQYFKHMGEFFRNK